MDEREREEGGCEGRGKNTQGVRGGIRGMTRGTHVVGTAGRVLGEGHSQHVQMGVGAPKSSRVMMPDPRQSS